MPIDTNTLLAICIRELHAAHDEAEYEFGRGSQQADAIHDAMTWMDEWFAAYVNVATDQQRG